jgi:TetR/AcrR family transcriptional regulator, transcriptional repressor for nem operon
MNTQLNIEPGLTSARERILQAAHEEIYENGFQGFRIEAVLKKTQLAKGALYYYFPTKLALGYAVVDECIMGFFQQNWNEFLGASHDPLQAIKDFFQKKCSDMQDAESFNGCPLNNLVQEMSTLDKGFHERLQTVMMNIVTSVADALTKGQDEGIVRKDIDPHKTARFVLSSYQGIMGTTKCMQSPALMVELFDTLGDYVESLRVSEPSASLKEQLVVNT